MEKLELSFSIHQDTIKKSITIGMREMGIVYSCFVIVGYFSVIAKIAPYLESRYLVVLHPIIALVFVYILNLFRKSFSKKPQFLIPVICVLLLMFGSKMYRVDNLFAYDKNYTNINQVVKQENTDIALIVITSTKNWWPAMNEILTLRKVQYSYMMQERELDSLSEITKAYNQGHNKLLVYKGDDCKMKDEDFERYICQNLGYNHCQKLDEYMGKTYLLER